MNYNQFIPFELFILVFITIMKSIIVTSFRSFRLLIDFWNHNIFGISLFSMLKGWNDYSS